MIPFMWNKGSPISEYLTGHHYSKYLFPFLLLSSVCITSAGIAQQLFLSPPRTQSTQPHVHLKVRGYSEVPDGFTKGDQWWNWKSTKASVRPGSDHPNNCCLRFHWLLFSMWSQWIWSHPQTTIINVTDWWACGEAKAWKGTARSRVPA